MASVGRSEPARERSWWDRASATIFFFPFSVKNAKIHANVKVDLRVANNNVVI